MTNQEKLQARIKEMKQPTGTNLIDQERRMRNFRLRKQHESTLRRARYQKTRTPDQKTSAVDRAAAKLLKAWGL